MGAPDSSTIGTTCGGLTGCATRQRWRPFSFSVKREATMAEDDEARIAPAGAAASSFWNRSILTSTRSGPLSITSSVPCTASSSDAALLTRFAAAAGSLARPWRATSCSDCAIKAGAAASALGSGSQMRTSQPLRENTLAQARPISPTPTSPTVGMPLLRCSLDPLSLACRPQDGRLARSCCRGCGERVPLSPRCAGAGSG